MRDDIERHEPLRKVIIPDVRLDMLALNSSGNERITMRVVCSLIRLPVLKLIGPVGIYYAKFKVADQEV
jgi:hypothetical protein